MGRYLLVEKFEGRKFKHSQAGTFQPSNLPTFQPSNLPT